MLDKKAYTPAEFAALFGREKTWTYRLLYAGKLNCISAYGNVMIPASEVARVESDFGRYLGKRGSRRDKRKGNDATVALPLPVDPPKWEQWVRKVAAGEIPRPPRALRASFKLLRKAQGESGDTSE